MAFALFLISTVALGMATLLLLAVGHRLRVALRPLGLILAVLLAVAAAELAGLIWRLPTNHVRAGEAVLIALCLLVVAVRPQWNPVGQVFYGTFLAAALVYLGFAVYVTFGIGLSIVATIASCVLLLFELLALLISASFTFESCDVLCRVRWDRPIPDPDPSHQPFVSLQ